MKCPHCNYWADAFDTRTNDDHTKRRRYECMNGHRFITLECVEDESQIDAQTDDVMTPHKDIPNGQD